MKNSNQDEIAIAATLEDYYFKGINEGRVDLLRQVYFPGTLLFGDVKGEPYFKTLEEYLYAVQNRQSPKDSGKPFKGEIVSISVINSIAIVEAKVRMYDFDYREFLSFHKLEGRWVLVNKMLSDVNK